MKSRLEFETAIGFDEENGTMWPFYIFPKGKDESSRVCYGMKDGSYSLAVPEILMMNRIIGPMLRRYDQEIEARRRAAGP